MKSEPSDQCRGRAGFSLIEMLIAVAIIMIMAAVALPNIAQYMRTYNIRGAADEVAGELQATRARAIMSNTNAGVSLVIVDADSYRMVKEDLIGTGDAEEPWPEFGTLKDLPRGVLFESISGSNSASVRFNRLGGYCNPADTTCGTATTSTCKPEESNRCTNIGAGLSYVAPVAGSPGTVRITLHEQETDLRTTIRLVPGGRVFQNPGWDAP